MLFEYFFADNMKFEWLRLPFGTNPGFIRIERGHVQVDEFKATIADSHESCNHWAMRVDAAAGEMRSPC